MRAFVKKEDLDVLVTNTKLEIDLYEKEIVHNKFTRARNAFLDFNVEKRLKKLDVDVLFLLIRDVVKDTESTPSLKLVRSWALNDSLRTYTIVVFLNNEKKKTLQNTTVPGFGVLTSSLFRAPLRPSALARKDDEESSRCFKMSTEDQETEQRERLQLERMLQLLEAYVKSQEDAEREYEEVKKMKQTLLEEHDKCVMELQRATRSTSLWATVRKYF